MAISIFISKYQNDFFSFQMPQMCLFIQKQCLEIFSQQFFFFYQLKNHETNPINSNYSTDNYCHNYIDFV